MIVPDVVSNFVPLRDIPLWGAFFTLLGIAAKQVIPWRQQTLNDKQTMLDRYTKRVKELVADVAKCRTECDEQERRLQEQIDLLKTKINNEAWQRVQSEISLVHTLIQVVDAPQLKIILAALKTRSHTIPPEVLEGSEGAGNGIERA